MMNRTVSHRLEQFARLGGKMVHGTAWTRLAMASLLLGALASLLIGLRVEAQSGVNVFVVDSAADDADLGPDGVCATAFGECTLRAAIEEANDVPNEPSGPDEIHFAIPGSGVHTISPVGALPPIIDPLVIDGYTQPGASPNTLAAGTNAQLLIELAGTPDVFCGLEFRTSDSLVRGLVINGFGAYGVLLTGENNTVVGNFIGTDATGNQRAGQWL